MNTQFVYSILQAVEVIIQVQINNILESTHTFPLYNKVNKKSNKNDKSSINTADKLDKFRIARKTAKPFELEKLKKYRKSASSQKINKFIQNFKNGEIDSHDIEKWIETNCKSKFDFK